MLSPVISVIATILVFGNLAGGIEGPQKILLSIHYESKCPDSRAFVLQQLQPALQLLHEHIMLQLVPFGKSKSINYGENGFKCQHGPAECLGNMVQDCALYQMRHLSDLDKLEYVACEMAVEAGARGSMERYLFPFADGTEQQQEIVDPPVYHSGAYKNVRHHDTDSRSRVVSTYQTFMHTFLCHILALLNGPGVEFCCVEKSGLQSEQVTKCLRTRQGIDLQLDSEYLTLLVRPKFIPTVTVNALFDQKLQDNAQVDLTGTLCSMLQLTHACAQYYNALAMRHLLAYPIDAENLPIYITSK